MKKIVFLLCIIIFCQKIIVAQQVSLKHPLSESDYISLDKVTRDCFAYELSVSFSINMEDFYDNKNLKPDKPDSVNQIKEQEKKTNGDYYDAQIYSKIGSSYNRLFMTEDANKYFNKALDLLKEYVKNNPDSSTAYNILGDTYLNLGNLTEAGLAFQKSYDLNKNDSIAVTTILFCYLFSGNFDSALFTINKMIVKHPDNVYYCIYLMMTLYFQKLAELQKLTHNDLETLLKGKSAEEIIDLTRIKEAFERNKNDIQFELLYKFGRHLPIFLKCLFRTFADPSLSSSNFKFLLEENDLSELNKLESFYKTCLNDKRIPNKLLINKALGNICLLKSQTKSALPYLRKAIELKPLAKSTFKNNAAEDYDNLATAYLILKDTVSYEKIVEQKFNIRPAINPLPEDYLNMAKISLYHKDYLNFKKYSEEALKTNPNQSEEYIYLAAIDILNRDNKNAMGELNLSYKINPNSYILYVLQGICLLYDNDISTAYTSFQIAKKLMNKQAWIDNEIINKYFIIRTE